MLKKMTILLPIIIVMTSCAENSIRKTPPYGLDESVSKKEGRYLVFGMNTNNSVVLIRTVDNGPILMNKAYKLDSEVWLTPGKHKINTMCQFNSDGIQRLEPCNDFEINIEQNHYYILRIGTKDSKYNIEYDSYEGEFKN